MRPFEIKGTKHFTPLCSNSHKSKPEEGAPHLFHFRLHQSADLFIAQLRALVRACATSRNIVNEVSYGKGKQNTRSSIFDRRCCNIRTYGIEMLCGVSETKRIFYVFVFTEEEAKIGNFRGWIYS